MDRDQVALIAALADRAEHGRADPGAVAAYAVHSDRARREHRRQRARLGPELTKVRSLLNARRDAGVHLQHLDAGVQPALDPEAGVPEDLRASGRSPPGPRPRTCEFRGRGPGRPGAPAARCPAPARAARRPPGTPLRWTGGRCGSAVASATIRPWTSATSARVSGESSTCSTYVCAARRANEKKRRRTDSSDTRSCRSCSAAASPGSSVRITAREPSVSRTSAAVIATPVRTGMAASASQASPSLRPLSSSQRSRIQTSRSRDTHGGGPGEPRSALVRQLLSDSLAAPAGDHRPAVPPLVVDLVHLEQQPRPVRVTVEERAVRGAHQDRIAHHGVVDRENLRSGSGSSSTMRPNTPARSSRSHSWAEKRHQGRHGTMLRRSDPGREGPRSRRARAFGRWPVPRRHASRSTP